MIENASIMHLGIGLYPFVDNYWVANVKVENGRVNNPVFTTKQAIQPTVDLAITDHLAAWAGTELRTIAPSSITVGNATKASSASSADKVNHTLTFTGGSTATFNGSANVSVAIPTSLKNPNKLTFSGASTATYDGSAAVTVNIPSASTYTAGTGISISSNTISLATSGVSSGTYGSSTTIPVISVDAYGRITSISNYAISPVIISGLIWTNYSYTSELIAQTYTFNNPFNYNIFFIEFMLSTGLTYIRRFAMANGVAGLMGFITGSGAYGGNQTEGITTSVYETLRSWNVVSSTSIRFFECWYYTTSGTTGMHTTANLLYIPYRIWGTKYLCQ